MPAKLFLSVQFTTKTEPTPIDLLVLENTRYQRNAVVQPLTAQLGMTLLFLPLYSPKPGRGRETSLNSTCLTPKPLASSVYVHVPEAPSSRKLAISVMSLFPSPDRLRTNKGFRRPGFGLSSFAPKQR